MATPKFYAVRSPAPASVYTTWPECQKAVHGKAGALFKSFASRAEAEDWAGLRGPVLAPLKTGLRVYVDGSFRPGRAEAGWAWVAVQDGKEIARGSGASEKPAESRNIDGECLAAVRALQWLDAHNKTATICHDYEGLARWALKEWKANSIIAKWYQEAVAPILKGNRFEKVAAHSGDPWNDLVDELAKASLDKKG
jgi:ribonuclease HI